ncbi:unnamed protein product [Amoebophrya sp. A120]|nr:unnamed protein product [Amoebophrya sp. A120]|eukprot:GSA120T00009608001.1
MPAASLNAERSTSFPTVTSSANLDIMEAEHKYRELSEQKSLEAMQTEEEEKLAEQELEKVRKMQEELENKMQKLRESAERKKLEAATAAKEADRLREEQELKRKKELEELELQRKLEEELKEKKRQEAILARQKELEAKKAKFAQKFFEDMKAKFAAEVEKFEEEIEETSEAVLAEEEVQESQEKKHASLTSTSSPKPKLHEDQESAKVDEDEHDPAAATASGVNEAGVVRGTSTNSADKQAEDDVVDAENKKDSPSATKNVTPTTEQDDRNETPSSSINKSTVQNQAAAAIGNKTSVDNTTAVVVPIADVVDENKEDQVASCIAKLVHEHWQEYFKIAPKTVIEEKVVVINAPPPASPPPADHRKNTNYTAVEMQIVRERLKASARRQQGGHGGGRKGFGKQEAGANSASSFVESPAGPASSTPGAAHSQHAVSCWDGIGYGTSNQNGYYSSNTSTPGNYGGSFYAEFNNGGATNNQLQHGGSCNYYGTTNQDHAGFGAAYGIGQSISMRTDHSHVPRQNFDSMNYGTTFPPSNSFNLDLQAQHSPLDEHQTGEQYNVGQEEQFDYAAGCAATGSAKKEQPKSIDELVTDIMSPPPAKNKGGFEKAEGVLAEKSGEGGEDEQGASVSLAYKLALTHNEQETASLAGHRNRKNTDGTASLNSENCTPTGTGEIKYELRNGRMMAVDRGHYRERERARVTTGREKAAERKEQKVDWASSQERDRGEDETGVSEEKEKFEHDWGSWKTKLDGWKQGKKDADWTSGSWKDSEDKAATSTAGAVGRDNEKQERKDTWQETANEDEVDWNTAKEAGVKKQDDWKNDSTAGRRDNKEVNETNEDWWGTRWEKKPSDEQGKTATAEKQKGDWEKDWNVNDDTTNNDGDNTKSSWASDKNKKTTYAWAEEQKLDDVQDKKGKDSGRDWWKKDYGDSSSSADNDTTKAGKKKDKWWKDDSGVWQWAGDEQTQDVRWKIAEKEYTKGDTTCLMKADLYSTEQGAGEEEKVPSSSSEDHQPAEAETNHYEGQQVYSTPDARLVEESIIDPEAEAGNSTTTSKKSTAAAVVNITQNNKRNKKPVCTIDPKSKNNTQIVSKEELKNDSVKIKWTPKLKETEHNYIFKHYSDLDQQLPEWLINNLKQKFNEPMLVQKYALIPALSGADVTGVAKTGSGKTVAFLIPGLVYLETTGYNLWDMAMVLTPTRELAQQTCQVCKQLATGPRYNEIWPCLLVGGEKKSRQGDDLKWSRFVIGTCGRVREFMIESRELDVSRCGFLAIDEADKMLEDGFHETIIEICSRIKVSNRQTMFFSATWPQHVEGLSRAICNTTPSANKKNVGKNAHYHGYSSYRNQNFSDFSHDSTSKNADQHNDQEQDQPLQKHLLLKVEQDENSELTVDERIQQEVVVWTDPHYEYEEKKRQHMMNYISKELETYGQDAKIVVFMNAKKDVELVKQMLIEEYNVDVEDDSDIEIEEANCHEGFAQNKTNDLELVDINSGGRRKEVFPAVHLPAVDKNMVADENDAADVVVPVVAEEDVKKEAPPAAPVDASYDIEALKCDSPSPVLVEEPEEDGDSDEQAEKHVVDSGNNEGRSVSSSTAKDYKPDDGDGREQGPGAASDDAVAPSRSCPNNEDELQSEVCKTVTDVVTQSQKSLQNSAGIVHTPVSAKSSLKNSVSTAQQDMNMEAPCLNSSAAGHQQETDQKAARAKDGDADNDETSVLAASAYDYPPRKTCISNKSKKMQIVSMTGDMKHYERKESLEKFKKKRHCQIMVATDLIARGLDVPTVTHVIIYEFQTLDNYVHRIGRTCRGRNELSSSTGGGGSLSGKSSLTSSPTTTHQDVEVGSLNGTSTQLNNVKNGSPGAVSLCSSLSTRNINLQQQQQEIQIKDGASKINIDGATTSASHQLILTATKREKVSKALIYFQHYDKYPENAGKLKNMLAQAKQPVPEDLEKLAKEHESSTGSRNKSRFQIWWEREVVAKFAKNCEEGLSFWDLYDLDAEGHVTFTGNSY